MMKFLTVALLVGLAAAACPNQCSGHGRCEANDKCVCYQQTNTPWGQRNGWVGADCSLRSCPLGRAFDAISSLDDRVGHIYYTEADATDISSGVANSLRVFVDSDYALTRDETIHVRVAAVGATEADREFQWKFASDAFYQQPLVMEDNEFSSYLLTDHTTSGSPTLGVRLWFADVLGANLNDCSGHGICQDQKHFAADASKTYDELNTILGPYDAEKQMGCLCDLGFRGPDCSMIECPSGADPLGPDPQGIFTTERNDCSGRGICNYGTGQCACFKGYFGERCETQSNYI